MSRSSRFWQGLRQATGVVLEHLFGVFLKVIIVFNFRSFRVETEEAIQKILKTEHPRVKTSLIATFLHKKLKQSKYVQVAAAVVFASVVSCLQWTGVETAHWSATALFYSSIVFALMAVVKGAQQTMALPGGEEGSFDIAAVENSLKSESRTAKGDDIPVKRRVLLAFQWPIMLFTLSVLTFMAGLWSVVFSSLAQAVGWDDQAKISIMFAICNLIALAVFLAPIEDLYAFASNDYSGKDEVQGP